MQVGTTSMAMFFLAASSTYDLVASSWGFFVLCTSALVLFGVIGVIIVVVVRSGQKVLK